MNRRFGYCISLAIPFALAGCATLDVRPVGSKVPLFAGMGSHHRTITTKSPDAQRYFDQGLVWAFAFNHDEAIRSFEQAIKYDSDCAMAWWGIAYCNGPHINNPSMDDNHSLAAWDALQRAVSHKGNASAVEQDLIDALSKRYASPPPKDRRPLDEAYAAAMREVWKKHPKDGDVGTLFAESMMDLRPWDLWALDGAPRPETPEVLSALEDVLAMNPNHPGANHFYIHAVEASPHPDKAIAAADRLRFAVPAAGHLVHMPAHIDVRTGKWEEAAKANIRATEADRKYRAAVPKQGFYHIYMAHNSHFLAYASMMEGRQAAALKAAREMLAGVPKEYAEKNAAMVDGFMTIEMETLMRFGRWDEVLKLDAPPSYFPFAKAKWHFSRAVSYAAKGQVEQAEKEKLVFTMAVEKVPKDAMLMINHAHHVLKIAEHMLNGEIAFRKGKIDESVVELNKAIELEDQLRYMEPPEWIQPVRHTLGAILNNAGRYDEAAKVYRADLAKYPENGWSLYGMAQCLKSRGDISAAKDYEERFKKAWKRADYKITSTCACVAKADGRSKSGRLQPLAFDYQFSPGAHTNN